jgi:UPF0716 family protein affecting phage T7 exclusion
MNLKDFDIHTLLDKLGFNAILLLKIIVILAGAFIMERVLFALMRRAYERGEKGRRTQLAIDS